MSHPFLIHEPVHERSGYADAAGGETRQSILVRDDGTRLRCSDTLEFAFESKGDERPKGWYDDVPPLPSRLGVSASGSSIVCSHSTGHCMGRRLAVKSRTPFRIAAAASVTATTFHSIHRRSARIRPHEDRQKREHPRSPPHCHPAGRSPTESYSDQPYIVRTDDGAWAVLRHHRRRATRASRDSTWSACAAPTGAGPGEAPVDVEPIDEARKPPTRSCSRCPSGRIYIFYNHNTDRVPEVKCHDGRPPLQAGGLARPFRLQVHRRPTERAGRRSGTTFPSASSPATARTSTAASSASSGTSASPSSTTAPHSFRCTRSARWAMASSCNPKGCCSRATTF